MEWDRYTFPGSTANVYMFNCLAVILEVGVFGLYFFYAFECNRLTVSSAVRQAVLPLFMHVTYSQACDWYSRPQLVCEWRAHCLDGVWTGLHDQALCRHAL